MVKVLEASGLPVVHLCTLTDISKVTGANRILQGLAIPYPAGNIALSPEKEFEYKKNMVRTALKALETDIKEPTVFEMAD